MSKAFASIKRGLRQAIRHRKGKRVARLKLHGPAPMNAKAARDPQAVLRSVRKG
jgi:hypothetical protein